MKSETSSWKASGRCHHDAQDWAKSHKSYQQPTNQTFRGRTFRASQLQGGILSPTLFMVCSSEILKTHGMLSAQPLRGRLQPRGKSRWTESEVHRNEEESTVTRRDHQLPDFNGMNKPKRPSREWERRHLNSQIGRLGRMSLSNKVRIIQGI